LTAETLASKYIRAVEDCLKKIKPAACPVALDAERVRLILSQAEAYLEDAKYYMRRKEYETSLTAIAYSEGLIDALKLANTIIISQNATRETRPNAKYDSS
jgi:FAD synthetase